MLFAGQLAGEDQGLAIPDHFNGAPAQSLPGLFCRRRGCDRAPGGSHQDQRRRGHVLGQNGDGDRPPDEPSKHGKRDEVSDESGGDGQDQPEDHAVQRIDIRQDPRQGALAPQSHQTAGIAPGIPTQQHNPQSGQSAERRVMSQQSLAIARSRAPQRQKAHARR